MSSILKNLIIALGITVLIGIIYTFTIGQSEESGVTTAEKGSSVISMQNERILADTQEITKYKLDVSIFDDPQFRILEDYRVSIEDVRTGRSNPFVPVE